MKNICVLTGSRSEYGLLKPVMAAIVKTPGLKLSIIATGMHLSKEFGLTYLEIEKDGFKIDEKVPLMPKDDKGASISVAVGKGIENIARALDSIKPDILLLLGDRMEPLAGAIAAAFMNIPIAHIHGGDASEGGVDEATRHAITKFAQLHFPATKKSAERVIKMGEDPSRVFVVGAPGLDTILNAKIAKREAICKKFGLSAKEPYVLLVQHPISTHPEESRRQIRATLGAINELEYPCVVVYPNSDAGGRAMITEIEKSEGNPLMHLFKNVPHDDYISLLKNAGVLVGNSSSGIIEAPSLHVPVVNIGLRQAGRERAENVLDADYNKDQIISGIKKALFDEQFKSEVLACRNPYGEGRAGQRIAEVLTKVIIDKNFIQKKIMY